MQLDNIGEMMGILPMNVRYIVIFQIMKKLSVVQVPMILNPFALLWTQLATSVLVIERLLLTLSPTLYMKDNLPEGLICAAASILVVG